MRKQLNGMNAVIGLLILFSVTATCYAGSVPEDLLSSDNAQVYFGEIKSVDGDGITVIKRQNIKGPFTEDSEITYADFAFIDSPEVGEHYLCGYFDESNPLYLWEVTSFDTKTLKIKNGIGPNSMSQRLQEYLNAGKFEEMEKERLSAMKGSEPPAQNVEESSIPETEDASAIMLVNMPSQEEGGILTTVWILGGIAVAAAAGFAWKKIKH